MVDNLLFILTSTLQQNQIQLYSPIDIHVCGMVTGRTITIYHKPYQKHTLQNNFTMDYTCETLHHVKITKSISAASGLARSGHDSGRFDLSSLISAYNQEVMAYSVHRSLLSSCKCTPAKSNKTTEPSAGQWLPVLCLFPNEDVSPDTPSPEQTTSNFNTKLHYTTTYLTPNSQLTCLFPQILISF